jgi:hypothetical protein
MVGGLLTVAFLFFVFAQAAVVRGSGQSAADAAALAAAQEARDQLLDDLVEAAEDGEGDGELDEILDGEGFDEADEACDEAAPRLADQNDADVNDCFADVERYGYTVSVETRDTVGDSLLPGTEDQTATVTATAVINGRCEVDSAGPNDVELSCEDGEDVEFDPGDEDEHPEARDLFDVYLED